MALLNTPLNRRRVGAIVKGHDSVAYGATTLLQNNLTLCPKPLDNRGLRGSVELIT